MKRLQALFLLFFLAMSGCASQAYLEGRELITMGRFEEGLARVQEAVRAEPDKREYRTYLLRQRELALAQVFAEADAARAAGRREVAEAFFKRADAIDPGNVRARQGLEELAASRRLAASVREADELHRKGDVARAEAKARAVLAESPQHPEARALMRRIEEKRAADVAPGGVNSPFSRPITLEFRDAPVRAVFETMSRLAGINFVFDRDVRQDLRVTIFVRNTSIDEVMRLILSTNQLERKLLNEHSVLIYPNTPAKTREHAELALRTFYLTNIDTKQAQTMIRALAKTRDMYADEKLNAIIVRDTPDAIRLVEQLITSIDLPEPEVMLEIEVMEIASGRVQEIGIRWPNQVQYGQIGVTGQVSARPPFGAFTTSVANPVAVANLRADVSATNTLANPRIRVRNREKAKVHIGDKLPVFTTTSTANVGVSASVSYLDVGLKLDIEPQVYLDNEVAMKVALEVSTLAKEVAGPAGSIAYQVGTRLTNTVLRLKDGETQILAGLINDEDRSTGSRLPGLGDIPILGRLFGSQQDTRNKTEIVLLITPRVLRNLVPPQALSATLAAGTEAQVGVQPLRMTTAQPRSLALAPAGPPGPAAAAPAAGRPGVRPRAAPPGSEAPAGEAPTQDAGPAPPPPPPEVAAAPPPAGGPPLTLTLSVNGEMISGREIGVSVGASAGAAPRAMQVDLAFDASVLEPIGAASDGPGRVTLTVQPPAAGGVVRFRVIGAAGAGASVGVAGVRFNDGGSSDFLAPPPLALQVRQ
jgi:general secretion pathway protein D